MVNPRRSSYSSNTNNIQNPENQSISFSTIINLFKKPLAFPILLTIFIFLTWVSLRFQHSSPSQNPSFRSRENDLKANLIRFSSSHFSKDKRGWLLNPVSVALHAGLSGGAVSCASAHVGEIRPGGMRGNHRHYTCNETFVLWGARIKFRLENSQVDKGYAEVIIGEDEIAVAGSPSGTAHAIVNIDPVRTAFLLGCQDSLANYNSSGTAFNIWNDL
ncbi:hypothetical protein RND81_14G046100 [Saponaria officinalis]|uniref:Uncharacterized protein n=1 Tax=Saponaria officinalis TaxID=3572 RepID=A0AAW1GJA8_SAPOF